jgi:hypothetical protein
MNQSSFSHEGLGDVCLPIIRQLDCLAALAFGFEQFFARIAAIFA